jgi:hypothetical protein
MTVHGSPRTCFSARLALAGLSRSSRLRRTVGCALLIAACSGKPMPAGVAPSAGAGSPDAGLDDGLRYARVSVELTQIRARTIIDPDVTDARDPAAATAWWPVTGTANLGTTPEGVDLEVVIKKCRAPFSYPVRIYEGADCSAIGLGSQPWDGARGEVEEHALCFGSPGARMHHSRLNADPKPWTLGGPAASNLIGRSLAILDPETLEPLACGTIAVTDGAVPTELRSLTVRPRDDVIAQLAGVCILVQTSSELPTVEGAPRCPDPAKITDCITTHCVSHCMDICADHLACLSAESDACASACEPSMQCKTCLDGAAQCSLGFCRPVFSCAPPPTPNGPCTELRACCARQGSLTASCLEYAELLENLSGDPSCLGAIYDWDFNTNFVYRSPCDPATVATE